MRLIPAVLMTLAATPALAQPWVRPGSMSPCPSGVTVGSVTSAAQANGSTQYSATIVNRTGAAQLVIIQLSRAGIPIQFRAGIEVMQGQTFSVGTGGRSVPLGTIGPGVPPLNTTLSQAITLSCATRGPAG